MAGTPLPKLVKQQQQQLQQRGSVDVMGLQPGTVQVMRIIFDAAHLAL